MIDISVLKRGGFNQFSTKSKAAQRQDEATLRQEEGKYCFDSVCRTHGRDQCQGQFQELGY